MHVPPLSYKIGACQIFVKNFSAKNKQIFEFGLVQPGPYYAKNNEYAYKNTIEKPRKINTNRQNEINKAKKENMLATNLKHDNGS